MDEKRFVFVNCNFCGSMKQDILFRTSISPFGFTSNLVKCKNCGLAYFNPRYSLDEELEFYKTKYQEAYGENFWYESRINFFRWVLNKINSIHPVKGKMLDVGCGMGFFLKEAKYRGWESVSGTEVSQLAVKYSRNKLGLDVIKGDLIEIKFPERHFDVVTSWNVIDQLQHPVDTLKEIYRILNTGGLLGLRVSNLWFHLIIHKAYSLLSNLRFFKNVINNPSCFHIYAFSSISIIRILRNIGYSNIRVYNSPIEGGNVAQNALEKFGRKMIYSISQILYYLTLGKLVLSPSLLVFARKTENT